MESHILKNKIKKNKILNKFKNVCKLQTVQIALGKSVFVGFVWQPEASLDDRRKWNRLVVPQAGYPGSQRQHEYMLYYAQELESGAGED